MIRRKAPRKPVIKVWIFRNGDQERKPMAFNVSSVELGNWEEALSKLSTQVKLHNGPVKR